MPGIPVREYEVFGKPELQHLVGIPVSHIYHLRAWASCRQRRARVARTQNRQVLIAQRYERDPQGRPGHLRVDTVHQGSQDGRPGL